VTDKAPDSTTTVVGVLADTHLPYRTQHLPNQILEIFEDVDLILHAGDVDRIGYLSDLAALAPLHAVRGNPHFTDFSDGGADLPLELRLTIAGYQVVVSHGGWPGFWSKAGDWFFENVLRPSKDRLNGRIARRLVQIYQADVIVFGHSHQEYQAWHDGTLVFNPGAVCPTPRQVPSVGKLFLGPKILKAKVIPLAG
jgi:putative phosphoesterase